jgi:branched-chain amino acid transport system ATP-binding protein
MQAGETRIPDGSPSRATTTQAGDPILELHDVVAGYGRMMILNGTGFSVRAGTITTVIGPNGAGKSTVFKTVFGLLPVRSGRIRFAGRDITGWSPRWLLQAGICYVPQGRNIFPELSVRHNLEIGAASLPDRSRVAGRVAEALERFPALRGRGDAQASTLSGGQQKLLEIARGLLLEPRLMLIDEPSIGLSPLMVQDVFAILKDLRARGVTVLMVEQNARSALQISDDGIVLELGRTRLHGPAEAILNDPRIGQLFLGGAVATEAAG